MYFCLFCWIVGLSLFDCLFVGFYLFSLFVCWMYDCIRCKQRGPYLPNVPASLGASAVEACNVFFHLMYEGAVDLATLRADNPSLYQKARFYLLVLKDVTVP